MANYIVSYDLNGSKPTHAEIDAHINKKTNWTRGRILETVWYIGAPDLMRDVYDYVRQILSENDALIVVHAGNAVFKNLLITSESLKTSWSQNA